MSETSKTEKTLNGYDLGQVQALADTARNQPKAVYSTLLSKIVWKSGFYSEGEVKDWIAGGNRNQTTRAKPFIVPQDHPPEVGGGTNKAPTAGELLVTTLGHCVTVGFALSATLMGIPIESLYSEVEGDIDLQGTLGLPTPGAVRPGFQAFRVKYYVKSKAPKEQLEKAVKMGEDLSPVKDSLRAVKFSSQLIIQ